MNQIELQGKSIDALKSFNNTIVTSRLYPPDVPQVANVVDRGYKNIKTFLRQYGDLSCSLQGEDPYLCGAPLPQDILDSFSNLVIYRQLRLLGLSKLVFSPEMDRFAFGQLLLVFNASVDKIKNQGGGLEYITSLGLASYFPLEVDEFDERTSKENSPDTIRSRNLVKVRPELVACLFGKDKRPVVETELNNKMASSETAIEILAAGVAYILRDIQKKKMIVAARSFPSMLQRAEMLLEPDSRKEIALGLAKILVESLKEPALCVVSAQEYPEGFGSMVYDGLLTCLTTEKLAGIVALFREQLAKVTRTEGADSLQGQFLEKALALLTSSKKGKQYLSIEKARTLIHEGEKERKKRRLEAGMKGFLQGNASLLRCEELVNYLPVAVRQIQKSTGDAEVAVILKGMVAHLKEGGGDIKAPLLKSLIAIAGDLVADGRWNLVDVILEPLVKDVRQGDSGEILVEKSVTLLQQVMQKSWQDGDNDRGDTILGLFYQIRSGEGAYPASIRAIVGKVQDREIRRADLPRLLAEILVAPKDEKLRFRLIHQGPVALRFLVEALVNTDNAPDRLKILDLLTYSPHFLPAVIHERLQDHMAWHGKRNLIKLLGETGNEADAEKLLPYLRHEDFRVQRETFLTLYKLGGKNKKRLLLRALEESSEAIKIQIVEALAAFCDPEVAGKLVELLASHEQFDEKYRNDLLLKLLDTLGRCPCPPAHKGVHAFLEARGLRATRKIPEHVWEAAEKALKFLHSELQETRKKHVQASQLRKNALMQAAKMSKTAITQRVITTLSQEQTVRTLLSRGDKTAAAEQVLELIERSVRLRNFSHAEKLRDWLIEIDSTALSQILRAAEIIDREKIAAIDKSHLEIWGGLYDILTTDEFTAVYHALTHKKYEDEEVIISQGDLQGALFFINSGNVKLYFEDQGSEVLVKNMGRGDIFGGDSFFEASVWTVSVAAVGTAEISVLKLDTFHELVENFPGLEGKLCKICEKSEKIEVCIKRNESDRRLYKRYRISGRITAMLLDNRGRNVGSSFMAELVDISEGGLSFLIRIAQKEDGRLLLGRKMQLKFPGVEKVGDGVTLIGVVLAVKSTYVVENDYSLHLKFDGSMDQKQIQDIIMSMHHESSVIK